MEISSEVLGARAPIEMTEEVFECVRVAVNLARDRQIKSVKLLFVAIVAQGYSEDVAKAAIGTWAKYESTKTQH